MKDSAIWGPLSIIGVSSRDSRVLNFKRLWRICWRGSCNTQTHTHYITSFDSDIVFRSGRQSQSLFVLGLIAPSSPSWSISFYTEMPFATDEPCEGPSRSWECRKLSWQMNLPRRTSESGWLYWRFHESSVSYEPRLMDGWINRIK